MLEFVETAGAALKWGEEGIKTRFLVPLPSAGAKVGGVFSARAAGEAVGKARVERRVKGVEYVIGVDRGGAARVFSPPACAWGTLSR